MSEIYYDYSGSCTYLTLSVVSFMQCTIVLAVIFFYVNVRSIESSINRLPLLSAITFYTVLVWDYYQALYDKHDLILYEIFTILSWILDFVPRTMLLYYTFHRTYSVSNYPKLFVALYVLIQVTMLAGLALALYADLAGLQDDTILYTIYPITDIIPIVFHFYLVRIVYRSNRKKLKGKSRWKVIWLPVTALLIAAILLLITPILSINAWDNYWVYWNVFFQCNCLLVMIYNNTLFQNMKKIRRSIISPPMQKEDGIPMTEKPCDVDKAELATRLV